MTGDGGGISQWEIKASCVQVPPGTGVVLDDSIRTTTPRPHSLIIPTTLHPPGLSLCPVLCQIATGMRATLVTTPTYAELKLLHTFRRLYQSPLSTVTTQQKQDLARRLSLSYRILQTRCKAGSGSGREGGEEAQALQSEMGDLRRRVEQYQEALDLWGLRDYQVRSFILLILLRSLESAVLSVQVPALDTALGHNYGNLVYTFLHAALVWAMASVPTLILNAPVGLAARLWAKREAQKDLKASRVKLAARDVLMSKKILFSMVAVPTLWVSYALLLVLFSPLSLQTVALLFLSCPVFSYLGVRAVEAGMVDVKDLRPVFLRLLPSFAEQRRSLPAIRAQLQKDVRAFVSKYGPSLGDLYTEKEISSSTWESMVNNLRQMEAEERDHDAGEEAHEDRGGTEAQHERAPEDLDGASGSGVVGRMRTVPSAMITVGGLGAEDPDADSYNQFSSGIHGEPLMDGEEE